MTQEKRKHRRFEMELPVTLRTHGKLIPAATLDISLGGICLLTDLQHEIKNGPVEVVVDLNSDLRDISLKGKVLRSQNSIEKKVAIEFNSPSSGLKSLKTFLSQK
ncbi:MAG: PilZ domain-containing protein [Deltaproteobacteria bacterium]|nr:PilZ domain-containing protein [Deltaproteobacteria bacterium]